MPLHPVYVASNCLPAPIPEIIRAFRRGFERPARLFAMPAAPLRAAATLLGEGKAWEALIATQICDPLLLVSEGWAAGADTLAQLAELARRSKFGSAQV